MHGARKRARVVVWLCLNSSISRNSSPERPKSPAPTTTTPPPSPSRPPNTHHATPPHIPSIVCCPKPNTQPPSQSVSTHPATRHTSLDTCTRQCLWSVTAQGSSAAGELCNTASQAIAAAPRLAWGGTCKQCTATVVLRSSPIRQGLAIATAQALLTCASADDPGGLCIEAVTQPPFFGYENILRSRNTKCLNT